MFIVNDSWILLDLGFLSTPGNCIQNMIIKSLICVIIYIMLFFLIFRPWEIHMLGNWNLRVLKRLFTIQSKRHFVPTVFLLNQFSLSFTLNPINHLCPLKVRIAIVWFQCSLGENNRFVQYCIPWQTCLFASTFTSYLKLWY